MDETFSRTIQLIGETAFAKLRKATVAVFGVGGVGSYTVEALARSGVGRLVLIDGDTVAESNINRQLIALHSTVGKPKVEVCRARIADIDPFIKVETHFCFFDAANTDSFDFCAYDYVVDAVDRITSKLIIIEKCRAAGVAVISAMGAGNKLDATGFRVADIFETSVCPLAKVMRRELRARGIDRLKVVYSQEEPHVVFMGSGAKQAPASIAFVPSVAGLTIAGEVIKDLII
ncbi:MAG: tRNA threonylcarbamoyladenosine dehydratase [Clostridia bacterium]|nr:tRNA threonylcarbamoyladenosine dehydratase [Clostridia bacterium]